MASTRRVLTTALFVMVWAWPGVGAESQSQPQFTLAPRDHIAIVGNTLAERFQIDGWLEATIQARFPQHELVFRNLGFSGDEVGTRLRSMNFGTPDEWLSATPEPIGGYQANRFEGINTRPDVIFAFFGYNESYAGEAGLASFVDALAAWIDHTLAQRYNGRSAPRLVLFSPIAHEDLGNPDLPSGQENNGRLARYTDAMRELAAAKRVTFVDLFSASQALYAADPAPLTINGVHLTPNGNRQIAQVIDGALFGAAPPVRPDRLEAIRQAVVEKDHYWFNRYRVTNGYSTYGERAFLTFVRGTPRNVDPLTVADAAKDDILPSNYEVLQRELPVLDVMTRNRDRRIWAVAAGGDLVVDDRETPTLLDAGTNMTSLPPMRSGEDGIALMTVAPGLRVNLFASEAEFPELANPVQMAFDTRGRLWVAAWKNYPQWQPKTPMDDKLLILEDTDGDGRADRRTVFAGDLQNPTGFEFYNGGVIVGLAPNLVFLKDTDGDDRYDERTVLLHGFDTADTHHALNSFTFDPGGGLYLREGIFHRTQVETPWAPTLRQADGGVYRFEPRTWKLETYVPFNFPNPHGHVFDAWGRDIITDATGGQPYYGPSFSTKKVYPAMETKAAPKPGDVRVRPVGGTALISGGHFPEEYQGNFVVLNTIGFRGLLNYRLSQDGAGVSMTEAAPILQSSDENFRPVDAEMGPDGALYVLDWYNPLIGHMQHNLRDTSRDHAHGRVYRITADGRPLTRPPVIAGAPVPALVDLLASPDDRVRYRVKIELSARDSTAVVAAVNAWTARLDSTDTRYEHHLLEALWVQQWHNRVDPQLLRRMLASPEPLARAAAVRVLCLWRDRMPDALTRLGDLARDAHPAVRLEAVRAASFFPTPEAARVALTALDLPQDRFVSYTLDQAMAALRPFVREAGRDTTGRPRVLIDVPARAVEYQVRRLSNDDLAMLDRRPDDRRYRAVYYALLTRTGLARQFRDEAISVLTTLDGLSRTGVLLEALRAVDTGDEVAADRVIAELLAEPAAALLQERDVFVRTAEAPDEPGLVRRGAYAALLRVGERVSPAAFDVAAEPDRWREWLQAVSLVAATESGRRVLADVQPIIDRALAESGPPAVRAAAVAALGATRTGPEVVEVLGRALGEASDDQIRMAAVQALQRIPETHWTAAQADIVASALARLVGDTPPSRRTEPLMVESIALGERLGRMVPGERGLALRRDILALGVRVVRIETVPEQMRFTTRWFAVRAGARVQIVLFNPDAMPHNVVVGRPGSLEAIGTAGSAMALPVDPAAKPYVPESPLVVAATSLVWEGQTARLNFTAPLAPGEYVFVCTYPGHWARMYGVMVVVDDLEAWEANPTIPTDPLTGQPMS